MGGEMTQKMTYSGVGVDYDAMDPFKRLAQEAAKPQTTLGGSTTANFEKSR